MGQITNGVRSILSRPVVYDALQGLMGARKIRQELVSEFIRPAHDCLVVDVGCGTAEIVEYFDQSVRYIGFDISAEYIDAAKSRYGGRGEFRNGLFTEQAVAGISKADIVIALGVLHHLDDAEASHLFSIAFQALRVGGRMITIDPCFAVGQNPIARFLISKDRGQNVRDQDGYYALASSSFNEVTGVLRHRTWVPYTHWIMECRKDVGKRA